MKKPQLLVARELSASALFTLRPHFEFIFIKDISDKEMLDKHLHNVTAAIWSDKHVFDEHSLQHANHLSWLVAHRAHMQLSAQQLQQKNIEYYPDQHEYSSLHTCVADAAIAYLLALGRGVVYSNQFIRAGKWVEGRYDLFPGDCIKGKTLGLFGVGDIIDKIAYRAHYGFNMHVLMHTDDNDSSKRNDSLRFLEHVSKSKIFEHADYILLNFPARPENHHFINQAALQHIKHGACLINMAHAEAIDPQPLRAALQAKTLSGLGLDIFSNADNYWNQFDAFDNVVCSPSISEMIQTNVEKQDLLIANRLINALTSTTTPTSSTWGSTTMRILKKTENHNYKAEPQMSVLVKNKYHDYEATQ